MFWVHVDHYLQSYNQSINMVTLAFGHIPLVISSSWGDCMHIIQQIAANNANFIHQVAYMCQFAVKLPNSDLNPQPVELGSLDCDLNHSATEARLI